MRPLEMPLHRQTIMVVSVERGFTSDPETWTPYSIILAEKD